MSSTLPFKMTPEAEAYIRRCLCPEAPGMEVALYMMSDYHEEDESGRVTHSFSGECFAFGEYELGKRPNAEHFEILGISVSIVASTLERLRGQTLTLRKMSIDGPAVRTEYLVVA